MSTEWTNERVAELVEAMYQLGYAYAREKRSDHQRANRIVELLGKNNSSDHGWIERSLRTVDQPELRKILYRLMYEVGKDSSKLNDNRSFRSLGRAAWDLSDLVLASDKKYASLSSNIAHIWKSKPIDPVVRRLTLENYRCFRSIDVPLNQLTVLIGSNNTGKSVFLSAIRKLINNEKDPENDRRNRVSSIEPKVSADTSVGELTFGEGPRNLLQPVGFFHFPSTGVMMQSQGIASRQEIPQLGSDGSNVAAVYDFMLRNYYKEHFEPINQMLRELIPGFESILIATPQPAERELYLLLEDGLRLPASEASTGVRLMLTFAALVHHPTPPRVVLLEEPEAGVHPRRLEEIVNLLKDLTKGRYGAWPTQVIMTTHSPHLLSCIEPDEAEVLVFQRQPDGERTVKPFDKERLKHYLKEFSMGEIWFNETEEGLVASR
jgi:predicted ATPase